MDILFLYFLTVVSLIQLHLAVSPSSTQSPDPSPFERDSDDIDPGEVINPLSGGKGEGDSEDALILSDDDEYYDEILDPVAQKVYFKALKSILHVRDSLCPIYLTTLYIKDAMPFRRSIVINYLLN